MPPPMLGGVASERELKPVYLLTGTDRPKIALALQRLRERIGEDATEQLHAREAPGRTPSPPATPSVSSVATRGSWSSTASSAGRRPT